MRFSLHTATLTAFLGLFVLQPALQASAQQLIATNTEDATSLPDAPQPAVNASTIDAGTAQGSTKTAPASSTASNKSTTANSPAIISGTVMDSNGDLIPGATVELTGNAPADHQSVTANDSASFEFDHLKKGVSYHVVITSPGFVKWVSQPIVLDAGQFFILQNVHLAIEGGSTSVTVYSSPVQIATEQVQVELQQRVLGFIPNFYVVYDKDPAPLTAKLKFQMALKVSYDPVSIAGIIFMSSVNQAADRPAYQQGWLGYGQRVGQEAADSFSDIFFGGAVLPSLLHQDPRYYYQGEGSNASRLRHALSAPFICKGDNGKNEINFSSMGGDAISASLSNLYYPSSDRGAGTTIESFAISTAEREVSTLLQEFVLRKLTSSHKKSE